MFYLHPVSKDLREAALAVGCQLQDWLDVASTGSLTLNVSVEVADPLLSIRVGEIVLWNSEEHTVDELTFSFCQEQLRDEINALVAAVCGEPEDQPEPPT